MINPSNHQLSAVPNRADLVSGAIATFCRLHGVDPSAASVVEFRVAILSEVSGAFLGLPGTASKYIDRHSSP